MDVDKALAFVEKLVFDKTQERMTDLQRAVFRGAWLGRSYQEIHRKDCAHIGLDYVMKHVGPKLWHLLSEVLGEEVTKSKLQGSVERAWRDQEQLKPVSSIFISHLAQNPDLNLAQQLSKNLTAAGQEVFMSGESVRLGANWPSRLDAELEQCDCFVLLLSPQAAVSEMVTEAVRRARELREKRTDSRPSILPIRFGMSSQLNHDLRGYLQGIVQWEWRSPTDTQNLVQAILNLLANVPVETPNIPPAPASPEDGQPLPVASPELPGGQVRLTSAFYVERPLIESSCYQEILQPGALIRIKAPRQMGKTSLMARILYRAREQNYHTVPLSFQLADATVFTNLDKFLQWLCACVGQSLRLPNQLADYWDDIFGSSYNSTAYFENYLLTSIASPLVIGLDEVDRVFAHPEIANDFFGLLRAWYEKAKYGDGSSDIWEKLRLVVVHSTEVYIPMNINQSPFNVGLSVDLPEFNLSQVQDLAQRHRLDWTPAQVEQLMALVGGHPYLVRVALYHTARNEITLNQLLQTAATEAGLYSDHLRRHFWNLEQHPELAAALNEVVTTNRPIELTSALAFKLHSMGLVKMEGNNVLPRCDLYSQYFRERLRVTE